ncbi:MAG: hypothetical protein HRU38_02815 [Saccharospirillaceae bacterium]|nr:hypothetical protein [Pseudomonadales bacterium]NRB77594.1 hypothetical protein [Saccharospirillaceae bacterium]
MDILAKSDSEILEIAEPMWDDIVKGSNEKNWELFSKSMDSKGSDKEPASRKDVEQQWENSDLLTSLTPNREFLSILRKEDCVLVLWKQWSTKVKGDFLASLYLKSVNDEVKSIGIWLR